MLDLNAIREAVAKDLEVEAKATPGVWNWRISLGSKCVRLESSGRGAMLEYVMDFVRWGMGGAKPRFLDQEKCLMVPSDKLAKVIKGREHHADWCQDIDHPDANMITHARNTLRSRCETILALADEIERLRRLLDKPEGIACPFCGEQGFDTEGLKRHLTGGMFHDGCAQVK